MLIVEEKRSTCQCQINVDGGEKEAEAKRSDLVFHPSNFHNTPHMTVTRFTMSKWQQVL